MKNEFSTVLYDIWDLLLSKRWCGYYQVLLAIFQTYEEKILSMKFDQLLQFLNNLAKAEFFTQNPEVRQNGIIGNRVSADTEVSGLEVPGD